MGDLEVVRALAGAWKKWQTEAGFPFGPKHCINGARVSVEALRVLGVAARPVSVQVLLFNAAGWQLWSAGEPASTWPAHAHSIGVVDGSVSDSPDWSGHLMVEGEDWTLDVSFGQFARPGKIVVDGPLVQPVRVPDDRWATFADEHGQYLCLARWPANNRWRQASGWKRPQPAEVAELVARTRDLLVEEPAEKEEHDD
jgi:hypothetical protein